MHSTALPNQPDISRFLEHRERQCISLHRSIWVLHSLHLRPRWLPWADFPTKGSEMKVGMMMMITIKGELLLGGQKAGPGSEGCPLGRDLNSRSQAWGGSWGGKQGRSPFHGLGFWRDWRKVSPILVIFLLETICLCRSPLPQWSALRNLGRVLTFMAILFRGLPDVSSLDLVLFYN